MEKPEKLYGYGVDHLNDYDTHDTHTRPNKINTL